MVVWWVVFSRVGLLGDPDAGRGVFGEGGQDHVPLAEAPEFPDDDGGVGHGASGLDAGYEGGGAGLLGYVGEGALCGGAGGGGGRDARVGACVVRWRGGPVRGRGRRRGP